MNQATYSVKEDLFGKFLTVSVDVSLYSLTSIMKSTYWFTDKCFIYLKWADSEHQKLHIIFRGKENLNTSDLATLAGEFFNYVLDQTIREQVNEETKTVKTIIVKRAFSEALTKQEQQFIEK